MNEHERDDDSKEFEHGAFRESLLIMHRQTPNAVVGHLIASGFVVFALSPVVAMDRLLVWWVPLVAIAIMRLFASLAFVARWPIADDRLTLWRRGLSLATLAQTTMWGLAAFLVWPVEVEYRAFLTAILLGVVAAGGIMLAVHRNSFVIYCLPIAIPVVYQLLTSGERLEKILAGLIFLYCALLFVAVNRLANLFIDGLIVRLRMQALSRIDALTGLSNRRGFDIYLEEMWQNAMRSGQNLGLIALDIDSFKAYNDTYGHPRGDWALRRVGEIMQQVAGRGTDQCARTGGEEFAVLLPSTELEGTLKIAEQIRLKFHEAAIEHRGSSNGYLTASFGVACVIPSRDMDKAGFIDLADKALYRAKREGKDRVIAAESARTQESATDAT